MKRILKYPYNRQTGECVIPPKAMILRVDHVDDGFYKGDFVWAIVDSQDEPELRSIPYGIGFSASLGSSRSKHDLPRIQLAVKEKQTVETSGVPLYAQEEDGKLYIYCENSSGFGSRDYEIAVYKTGQLIDLPIDRLTYLGLNRLWIIQELGLYTFLYRP